MALALLQPNGKWQISQLINIAEPAGLFQWLKSHLHRPGCIIVGFDFPIGLPMAYAKKAGFTHFLEALPLFGQEDWADFYIPADDPDLFGVKRPFYPAKPGSSRRLHIEQRLGLTFSQLYRLCEGAHQNRRAACPLFWTMGSQQVGKAAISGWQALLVPALHDPELCVKIWPFSGKMDKLCHPGTIVVAETYPAEFYSQLGLSFTSPVRRSKRRQADRIALASQLLDWAAFEGIDLVDEIRMQVESGFGMTMDGEDRFDALVGLYGMINVILGNHPIGEPHSSLISNIEGWIFGQDLPAEGNKIGISDQ